MTEPCQLKLVPAFNCKAITVKRLESGDPLPISGRIKKFTEISRKGEKAMAIKIKLGKKVGQIATILVNVTDDRNKPVDQHPVELFAAGIRLTSEESNDEGDIIFKNIPIDPTADIVTLTARTLIGGQWITKDLQVVNEKTKSLPPDRVSANTAGGNGKYIFIVGVLDKDNTPVQDVPVRILNENTGADAATGQTDQYGSFSSPEITFRESECSFLVIAGGLDPVQLKLEGPSKWAKVQLPPADPDDTQYGLWHAIATGWRRGRNAVKAARRNP